MAHTAVDALIEAEERSPHGCVFTYLEFDPPLDLDEELVWVAGDNFQHPLPLIVHRQLVAAGIGAPMMVLGPEGLAIYHKQIGDFGDHTVYQIGLRSFKEYEACHAR